MFLREWAVSDFYMSDFHMSSFDMIALLSGVALFVGMMICLEIGRRIEAKRLATGRSDEGTGAVEAAMFGLLGLLLAFTFSGAAARFDDRRSLVVEEANDIGTAYLRVDLLPAEAQPAIREKFKQYVDSRIETYRKIPDMEAVNAELVRSQELQKDIWAMSADASQKSPNTMAGILLLPALNAMIDITTTRTMASQIHPPLVIFVMLGVIVLASALIAGFSMAKGTTRSWLHIVLFAAIMTLTVYVIVDIEYPRLGLIRVDSFDQVMVDLRKSM